MAVDLALNARLIYELDYVCRPPDRRPGAELDRLGETPGTATLPPSAFADGDDGKDLGQTKKAVSGDVGLFL